MNDREQLELENYLRDFQPRAPKPLPASGAALGWRRVAAAVLIFVAGSIAIGSLRRRATSPPVHPSDATAMARESTSVLTRVALEDPREFSVRMDQLSLRTLKHFDGVGGPQPTLRESWKKETAE